MNITNLIAVVILTQAALALLMMALLVVSVNAIKSALNDTRLEIERQNNSVLYIKETNIMATIRESQKEILKAVDKVQDNVIESVVEAVYDAKSDLIKVTQLEANGVISNAENRSSSILAEVKGTDKKVAEIMSISHYLFQKNRVKRSWLFALRESFKYR